MPNSEPTSPSGSGSPPNVRTDSPTVLQGTPEWNGEGTSSRTPSRDSSAQNTPRNTPTQQQNRSQQSQQHIRNTPPSSAVRDRRPVRSSSDEQNGNQNANGRIERSNNVQPRRPNRSNRNRNNAVLSAERRNEPLQPMDLPRGYGRLN